MNKLMVAAAALLLGATAMTATADNGRGRDEGRGPGSEQGRGHTQSQPAQKDRGNYGGRGNNEGRRGGDHNGAARDYGQGQRDNRGNRGGHQYGGGQAYQQSRGNLGLASSGAQNEWRGDGRRDNHDRRGNNDRHYNGRSGYGNDYDRHGRGNGWNSGYRQGYRNDHHSRWNNDWRRGWNHGWSGHRYRAPSRYYYPRGYGYRSWYIGYRLPAPFYSSYYYVDYRPYGIAPPPYGCRWVRIDGDLVLVELATGVIVDLLTGFYY
ncbi:MAG: RcnB family protein [Rhodanobacteraceae bacterium]|nr:RcnB family protein [Rhodanobacteraceae bacterium]